MARRLRDDQATSAAYLVALTGYGQATDIEQAQQAGFDAHFLKPARLDDVLKLLIHLPKKLLH